MNRPDFWRFGEMSQLAHRVGARVQEVSDVFSRRAALSPERAKMWSRALQVYFRKEVPWYTMCDTVFTQHPAFSPLDIVPRTRYHARARSTAG